MAFTNIKYDEARVQNDLILSTQTGRYNLNVPGPGDKVPFNLDPFMRLQKNGSNLRTNGIQIENDLFGITKPLNKDCEKYNYKYYENYNSSPILYSNVNPYTKQSRATHPSWLYKDLQQNNMNYLPLNPQDNVCFNFNNNLSTRIIEKDYFKPTLPCVSVSEHGNLPMESFMNRNNSNKIKLNNCTQL